VPATRVGVYLVYPAHITRTVLGAGLSVYTVGAALQKALGSTPFSVTDPAVDSCQFFIALGYTGLGVVLGLCSLVFVVCSASLRWMGVLGAYLLAFAAVSLMNSPQTLWMQIANTFTFLGVSAAAFAAWLKYLREAT
jgi:hypothetical protein